MEAGMRLAMIIIRDSMYYETSHALTEAGFNALSYSEVVGRGKQRVDFTMADSELHQSGDVNELVSKVLIEVIVRDEDENAIIDTVLKVNRKNNSGDGKIFILPVEEALRIRTGEHGENALM
jgi:nitrogen regulatory protein PII